MPVVISLRCLKDFFFPFEIGRRRSIHRIPSEQIADSLWVVVDGICISSHAVDILLLLWFGLKMGREWIEMWLPERIAWSAGAIKSATGWWWRWRSGWGGGRKGRVDASRSASKRAGLVLVVVAVGGTELGNCRRRGPCGVMREPTTSGRANRLRPPNGFVPVDSFAFLLSHRRRSNSFFFFPYNGWQQQQQPNKKFESRE